MEIVFEWNERKAQQNLRKHGVSFEEATTVFLDPWLVTFFDEYHSDEEDRYVSIGSSATMSLLVVFTRNEVKQTKAR